MASYHIQLERCQNGPKLEDMAPRRQGHGRKCVDAIDEDGHSAILESDGSAAVEHGGMELQYRDAL